MHSALSLGFRGSITKLQRSLAKKNAKALKCVVLADEGSLKRAQNPDNFKAQRYTTLTMTILGIGISLEINRSHFAYKLCGVVLG